MTLHEFLASDDERVQDYVFEDDVLVEYVGKDEQVIVPEGVREIGINAFWNNLHVKHVVFPESLEKIGNGAFAGVDLQQLILPKHLFEIGRRAFEGCNSLEYVRIPAELVGMSYLAFDCCENLKKIEVDKGNGRFFNQDGMVCARYLTRPEEVRLHRCPTGVSGEICLDAPIDIVSEGAFSNCEKITAVHLPEGVRSVYSEAFYGCSRLARVELPDSLHELCDSAFARCENLRAVRLPDDLWYMGDHVFDGCYRLENIEVSDEALVAYCDRFGLLDAVYMTPAYDRLRERLDILFQQGVGKGGVDDIISDAKGRAEGSGHNGMDKNPCLEEF